MNAQLEVLPDWSNGGEPSITHASTPRALVQRGRRRRQQTQKQPQGSISIPLSDDIGAAKAARGTWARFIKKVFEIDPLLCPNCQCVMKIVSFIEDPTRCPVRAADGWLRRIIDPDEVEAVRWCCDPGTPPVAGGDDGGKIVC